MHCSFQSEVFVTLALKTAFERLPRPYALEYTEELPELTTTIRSQMNFDLKRQGLESIDIFIPDQKIVIFGFETGLYELQLTDYTADLSDCAGFSAHASELDLDNKIVIFE